MIGDVIKQNRKGQSHALIFAIGLVVLHVVALIGLYIAKMSEYAADERPAIAFFTALIVATCIDVAVAFRALIIARQWFDRAISASAFLVLAVLAGWMSVNHAYVLRETLDTVTYPVTMSKLEAVENISSCRIKRVSIESQRVVAEFAQSYVDRSGKRHINSVNYMSLEDLDSAMQAIESIKETCPIVVENAAGVE